MGFDVLCGRVPRILQLLGLSVAMQYFPVVCECGAVIEVTVDDSGEHLRCVCERAVRVPHILKETRELIRSLVAVGKLPNNERCPYSSEFAEIIVCFKVRHKDPRDMFDKSLVVGVLFGWLYGLLMWGRAQEALEERGSNTSNIIAELPLRFSSNSVARLRTASQRDCIRLLRTVPIYAYFLDQYRYLEVVADFS